MEKDKIDQLFYTWSTVGLDPMSAGYRVRAASTGLQNIYGERYRGIEPYLSYRLPSGINVRSVSPQDAPRCLSLIDTGRERLLVYKVSVGPDASGRPGNYFTHLLAGLPRDFTAREAILLWHAQHFWATDGSQPGVNEVELPQLSLDDLERQQRLAWNSFNPGPLQPAMRLVLAEFLQPSAPRKLYLSGSSESIATAIWVITQSLPRGLLGDMTFSTYEYDPTSSNQTIVGLFSEPHVPSLSLREISINVDTAFEPHLAGLETVAEQYIRFALSALNRRQSLATTEDQLSRCVALAERYSVNSVTEFLALFQQDVVYPLQQEQFFPGLPSSSGSFPGDMQKSLIADYGGYYEATLREETEEPATRHMQFSAFYPRLVAVEKWHTLLVYAHIDAVLEKVRLDARQYKDDLGSIPGEAHAHASRPLRWGAEVTIAPTCQGVTFNPQHVTLKLSEDWQQTRFRFQAAQQVEESAGNGEIAVYLGPIIIAAIKVAFLFERERPIGGEETLSAKAGRANQTEATTNIYRQIFVSYSHADTPVVLACRNAYRALGMEVLLDRDTLRSGQDWNEALLHMIEGADIFQLFWSRHSSRSEYVRKEWQYALQISKDQGFIRPVYWKMPLPPPPSELSMLHFAFIQLPKVKAFDYWHMLRHIFTRFFLRFFRKMGKVPPA